MAFPLIPLLLFGGGAAIMFLAPRSAKGGTIGPPQRITAPVGSRFEIDLTATNIAPADLERDLIASMQAKGNRLMQFAVLSPEHYRIIVEYGVSSIISINLPIETPGGVVLTTVKARQV